MTAVSQTNADTENTWSLSSTLHSSFQLSKTFAFITTLSQTGRLPTIWFWRVWRGAGVLIVGVGVQRLVAATDSYAVTDRLKT